jgi:hypothetical protein
MIWRARISCAVFPLEPRQVRTSRRQALEQPHRLPGDLHDRNSALRGVPATQAFGDRHEQSNGVLELGRADHDAADCLEQIPVVCRRASPRLFKVSSAPHRWTAS